MKEESVRIQTSVLSKAEKKVLIKMAKRMPRCINSDHLTVIGLAGAVISAAGYFLSNYNINYLWVASLGLIINWFGDSLDGTLARTRNAQRPIYGFYIDHNIDALTILIMCIGAGLSPIISFPVALLILAGYLILSIFTYINAHLKGEFCISYGKLGPTEFRIIVIIINTLFILFPPSGKTYLILGHSFSLFDIIGTAIAAILLLIYLISFTSERKKYAKKDPLPSFYK